MLIVPGRSQFTHRISWGKTANIIVGNWGGGQFERTMRSERRAFLPK